MSNVLQLPLANIENQEVFIGVVVEISASSQPIMVKKTSGSASYKVEKVNPLLGAVDYGVEILCIYSEVGVVAICQCLALSDLHPKITIGDSQLTLRQGEATINLKNSSIEASGHEVSLHCMSILQMQAFTALINCSADFVNNYRNKIQEQVNEDEASTKSVGY